LIAQDYGNFLHFDNLLFVILHMDSHRRFAKSPSRPSSGNRYCAPMAYRSSPKVHPWTPSRYPKSFTSGNLTREQAKALDEAWTYDRRFDGIPSASIRHSLEFWDFFLSPVVFGLLLAQRGVQALVRRILYASRQREAASAPSLRGTPGRKDIDSAWEKRPRTMQDALRLGSRLLDLEPTVDNSRVWKENPHTGRREVVFRHAGIKGWLQRNCPAVPYSTAMRYKKLASRLRTVCGLPGNIPLEWVLPDSPMPPAEGLDSKTLAAIEKGRRALGKILAEAKSLRGLDRVVEREMNLVRLPRKNQEITVISHDNPTTREEKSGKGAGEGRKKRSTVAEEAEKERRERLLAAMQQAIERPEGRQLWLHFRHLFSRAAEDKEPHITRGKRILPMFCKNA
jgi:hypothetical protein